MIKITFPDGSVREYNEGVTGLQIAESISSRLAQEVLACGVNGETVELNRPINQDAEVVLYKWEDEQGKHAFWHTSAHLLAEALQELYPGIQFGIGPAIENGFYYDVDPGEAVIKEGDLPMIEQKMAELVAKKEALVRSDISKADALKKFGERGETYKCELISELEDGHITTYTQGAFTDLCRGPHLLTTAPIKAIKLTSVAGAYWRGREDRKMMTRIYGITFPKKKMLDEYLVLLEEAKKRDHRKIGKEMDLFMLTDEGPGFPFFLPKGMIIRNELEAFWRAEHRKRGYEEIKTPLILNEQLWRTSGHWDHYKDNMYFTKIDDEDYAVKPMNCPGSMLVYKRKMWSYRDFPIRCGELGQVHRHELSGALHGLMRVRTFTQDDAHIFMLPEQVNEEIKNVAKFCDDVYKMFGFEYHVELSTRPEDSMGTDEEWEMAENALRSAIEEMGVPFVINEGDGAFYGPKLDFHLQDSIGRTWQCGTIQLDLQMPQRFDLTYVGSDNEKHRPIMIHRVIFGSIERFIGILTEHCAGKFPLWLAPVQVKLLTVTEKFAPYAEEVAKKLEEAGLRVELDIRNEKIGYKLREARNERVSYIGVIGEREAEAGTLTVRSSKVGELGEMSVEDFTAKLLEEIKTKAM